MSLSSLSLLTSLPQSSITKQSHNSPTIFNIHSFDEMGILMSVLYYISIWFYPQSRPIALESSSLTRPIALESSSLSSLPLELILYIARFLPPESTLSFCLCCWPIYSILKSQYVKIIKDDQQLDRYKFLTLLEQDLPDYILCYYCRRLHAMKKAHQYLYYKQQYIDKGYFVPCCKVDFCTMIRIYIHPAISFTVFHMTMKLYRQGVDYSKLLRLLSYQSESETHSNGSYSTIEKHTASSKIVAGSLFIREQRKFMMPPTQLITFPENIILSICRHIKFSSLGFYRHRDIMDIMRWRESQDYQNGNRLIKCKYCFTEFRIDFKEFGKHGNAIYITKWQDLGHGLSHLDPIWQSHILQYPYYKRVEFDLGSICSAFEGKEHIEFEFDSIAEVP
jgi:hypothetical protein